MQKTTEQMVEEYRLNGGRVTRLKTGLKTDGLVVGNFMKKGKKKPPTPIVETDIIP